MSIKDLLTNWEEALAVALSQPDKRDADELNDDDLETVADRRIRTIRANVRAGSWPEHTSPLSHTIGC